jgi:hypothetical protein
MFSIMYNLITCLRRACFHCEARSLMVVFASSLFSLWSKVSYTCVCVEPVFIVKQGLLCLCLRRACFHCEGLLYLCLRKSLMPMFALSLFSLWSKVSYDCARVEPVFIVKQVHGVRMLALICLPRKTRLNVIWKWLHILELHIILLFNELNSCKIEIWL